MCRGESSGHPPKQMHWFLTEPITEQLEETELGEKNKMKCFNMLARNYFISKTGVMMSGLYLDG